MGQLLPFFVILFSALFFSKLFHKLHLPWVAALMVAGIIVGPNGLNILAITPTMEFFADIGIVLLMFMAGLEVKIGSIRRYKKSIGEITILNSVIPFLTGFFLTLLVGYGIIPSLLMGIIFMSSAVVVMVPTLENNGLLHTYLGKVIVSVTMIQDILSLFLLTILLQMTGSDVGLSFPIFIIALGAILWGLRWLAPRVEEFFSEGIVLQHDMFEEEPRAIFAILLGTVICFELLGLHPIIAGFFSGLILSDSIKGKILKAKLHAIGYGLFIPFFFIIVGAQTDLSILLRAQHIFLLSIVLLGAAVFSKFASGYAGGRLLNFSPLESTTIGTSTIPRLSTTLAIAFTGFQNNLLSGELVTITILISVCTTFIGPLMLNKLATLLHTHHKDKMNEHTQHHITERNQHNAALDVDKNPLQQQTQN